MDEQIVNILKMHLLSLIPRSVNSNILPINHIIVLVLLSVEIVSEMEVLLLVFLDGRLHLRVDQRSHYHEILYEPTLVLLCRSLQLDLQIVSG